MGGQDGLRGYLVQALVTVIDSLKDDNEWISVTMEPSNESEKVDVSWVYPENKKKVVQVKSSRNPFSYSKAKKWAEELKNGSPTATSYELFLIGDVENKLRNEIDKGFNGVLIKQKPLDIEALNALISDSIDRFFSERGENKINYGIRTLISSNLKDKFLENSLYGKSLSRKELSETIINVIREIETFLKENQFSILLGISNELEDAKLPTNDYFISILMTLLGWKGFNHRETITEFNDRTGKDEVYTINYCGYSPSRLSDNEKDFIYVQSEIVDTYKNIDSHTIKTLCKNIEKVSTKFENQQTFEEGIKKSYHAIQFILSTDSDENSKSILSEIKSGYNYPNLIKDYTYYAVDNAQFNFLISSIAQAKIFRSDCSVRFLYPITEYNLSEQKIGNRAPYLPPQFINSSVIPIIKQDDKNNEISVLMFCKDNFSETNLKKMVWLTVALTTGLANNYRIYFPNYSKENDNDVRNILRRFGDESLLAKTTVDCIKKVDLNLLKSISLNSKDLNDSKEMFNDSGLEKNKLEKYKPNTDFLVNYLPYGSIIKPFLNDEFIKSEDLKLFLETKGLFFKNQDKQQIIDIMSKLLFSPSEIEQLIGYVIHKKREGKEIEKSPYIKANQFSNNQFYREIELKTQEIRSLINQNLIKKNSELSDFKINETNKGVEILVAIREKFPNKHAMVNEAETTHRLIFTNAEEYITPKRIYESEQGRKILQSVLDLVEKNLYDNKLIKEPTSEILFSSFTSNESRTNFLLSFENVNGSLVFKQANIKLSKYGFDESQNIPKELEDKIGRKLRMNVNGERLHELKELQDEDYKKFILLEKIKVELKFEYKGIKGNLYAELDFSDALKNEPFPDGILTSKTSVFLFSNEKHKVKNILEFEHDLKEEFSKFKTEKLKQFNLI
jgi:hypothetical protein